MTTAIIFPGQGSQTVGMGRDLHDAFPAARAVFEEVDEALGESLSGLMFEGDEDELTLTRNAQPALMAVSLAAIRALEAGGAWTLQERAAFVAGHSLGEYTALAAAGCLALADAARLLRLRGEAMQAAVPVGAGAMAALIGADLAQVEEIAKLAAGGEVCVVGNDNAPGQVVVSGARSAVERAVAQAPEHGIRRAVMLPVSAPFHSPLLKPAAETMAAAFEDVTFAPLAVPVVANVTARPVHEASAVPALLVRQVTAMVRWRESVLHMAAEGVDTLIEVGAGKVLTGLARRIDRSLSASSVGTAADVEGLLAEAG
ncbi:MAG: ACP S-malonyltransferase [Rhodospirillales bacterium]|nr:ACP S-malonyltransferase [Rhodospirillales bacterium]MDE0380031.1 ACP S-malonyltransferase [Rhodospirillales bacterium]